MTHDSQSYNLKSLLPGAGSATVSIIAGYPIDTVKTRMQTGMYRGILNCLTSTIKTDGVSGLYRGVLSPFAIIVTKRSIQFRIYEEAKRYTNPWLSGMIAAGCMSPVGNPMHVVKVHMQDSNKDKYKNVIHCIRSIYATHGIKGFFRGVYVNLGKDLAFGTMYLGSYGQLQKEFGTRALIEHKKTRDFISGGLAGSFTWFVLMPVDLIKIAYQSNRGGMKFIKETIAKDGVTSLWRGGVLAVSRVFPISALSMLTYETLKSYVISE